MDIRHVEGDRAYYRLKADEIVLRKWEQFSSATHYYQTALHEVGHATGHPERMNRESLIEGIKAGFGSESYAREELRAEISAMMTGEKIGIGHDPSRGAAYVESWIEALQEDPREIRRAAADAQRISDYILLRSRATGSVKLKERRKQRRKIPFPRPRPFAARQPEPLTRPHRGRRSSSRKGRSHPVPQHQWPQPLIEARQTTDASSVDAQCRIRERNPW